MLDWQIVSILSLNLVVLKVRPHAEHSEYNPSMNALDGFQLRVRLRGFVPNTIYLLFPMIKLITWLCLCQRPYAGSRIYMSEHHETLHQAYLKDTVTFPYAEH